MASLKNIKLKILSVKKTSTVTHAMEAVSAVKMRKSQERALSGRMYAATALSVLERISGTTDVRSNALMQEREGKTCFVIVTSDKGLAGSLNSGVVRLAEQEILRCDLEKKDIIVIAIGRRGGDYFASRGYDVRIKHENMSDGVSEEEMRTVTDKVLERHAAGEIGNCTVIYTNFLSTFEQQPTTRQIVPITAAMMEQMVANIRPARGKYAPLSAMERVPAPKAYTIEPDAGSVLALLLPKLLNIAVFHALLESKASEHSARMVAMKNATDKARDMSKTLTRTFNKVRQAAITREVSEITSGIEAMR
ncbi:ATP synthase F1 subunit gamma [Candidatus Kaiserbacteria bacterium RIFCSPHIGHO2_12_FULL_53_13]|uniref:ATP synthase gamma chain n=1 Tax=Candidatus Kaiserbacteria bacterium RIFCSPHIGHO2_12_FULL_53_13 TaxID=1798502 RepID=A0A1F6E7K4_9BACT|nr:MAG: ATP synthase F1 subunit gamma [Candidatus Kaiserbacteria bacterium RIFCSPHIGHO2_12_FULL_53_13]OGG74734.1 MAG: ATP synthase F1 subunit gamma [Candidatus Kaiserbacteria bacterium RIFCSPLOWO2_01_FULL_52_36]